MYPYASPAACNRYKDNVRSVRPVSLRRCQCQHCTKARTDNKCYYAQAYQTQKKPSSFRYIPDFQRKHKYSDKLRLDHDPNSCYRRNTKANYLYKYFPEKQYSAKVDNPLATRAAGMSHGEFLKKSGINLVPARDMGMKMQDLLNLPKRPCGDDNDSKPRKPIGSEDFIKSDFLERAKETQNTKVSNSTSQQTYLKIIQRPEIVIENQINTEKKEFGSVLGSQALTKTAGENHLKTKPKRFENILATHTYRPPVSTIGSQLKREAIRVDSILGLKTFARSAKETLLKTEKRPFEGVFNPQAYFSQGFPVTNKEYILKSDVPITTPVRKPVERLPSVEFKDCFNGKRKPDETENRAVKKWEPDAKICAEGMKSVDNVPSTKFASTIIESISNNITVNDSRSKPIENKCVKDKTGQPPAVELPKKNVKKVVETSGGDLEKIKLQPSDRWWEKLVYFLKDKKDEKNDKEHKFAKHRLEIVIKSSKPSNCKYKQGKNSSKILRVNHKYVKVNSRTKSKDGSRKASKKSDQTETENIDSKSSSSKIKAHKTVRRKKMRQLKSSLTAGKVIISKHRHSKRKTRRKSNPAAKVKTSKRSKKHGRSASTKNSKRKKHPSKTPSGETICGVDFKNIWNPNEPFKAGRKFHISDSSSSDTKKILHVELESPPGESSSSSKKSKNLNLQLEDDVFNKMIAKIHERDRERVEKIKELQQMGKQLEQSKLKGANPVEIKKLEKELRQKRDKEQSRLLKLLQSIEKNIYEASEEIHQQNLQCKKMKKS